MKAFLLMLAYVVGALALAACFVSWLALLFVICNSGVL